MISLFSRSRRAAFTLIELLCTIAIIVLLASLIGPAMSYMTTRAELVQCGNNLRQIDMAMKLKVQDNNNVYPKVESEPDNPIYGPEDGALPLAEILKPYGINERALRCPADVRGPNHFAKNGSSYVWFPLVDGEISSLMKVYLPAGVLELPLSRLPEAADFSSVHRGRQNIIFANGHVVTF